MTRADQEAARRSADRLALALEEAGFDVGQEFPALYDAINKQGNAAVRVGDVSPSVADRLSAVLLASTSQASGTEGDDSR